MCADDGTFVGQVCHIHSPEKKGPRYLSTLSNDGCRSYENLMLMCYEHHIRTHDVAKYSPSSLVRMKREHEQKTDEDSPAMSSWRDTKKMERTLSGMKLVTGSSLAGALAIGVERLFGLSNKPTSGAKIDLEPTGRLGRIQYTATSLRDLQEIEPFLKVFENEGWIVERQTFSTDATSSGGLMHFVVPTIGEAKSLRLNLTFRMSVRGFTFVGETPFKDNGIEGFALLYAFAQ